MSSLFKMTLAAGALLVTLPFTAAQAQTPEASAGGPYAGGPEASYPGGTAGGSPGAALEFDEGPDTPERPRGKPLVDIDTPILNRNRQQVD